VLLAILAGEKSPRADLVVLNAALGLVVASAAADIKDGMERARAAIVSGAAREALDALRAERVKEVAT
jgi:anthranilate phosphoribosyltransferase